MSTRSLAPGDYSAVEMMIVAAAREIRDRERVFAGAGLPLLAAILALRTHAPGASICLETGIVGSRFPDDVIRGKSPLPRFVMDPRIIPGATFRCGLLEVNGIFLPRGKFDVGFLGGAQVDRFGNLNSTLIGSWTQPAVWLPGSGGAAEIAMSSGRVVIIIAPHDRHRFREKVDLITSPGYLDGPGGRERHGLRGGGPAAVISPRGVMRFREDTKEMYLWGTFPGVRAEEVRANTGWDLLVAENIHEIPPPTEEEIEIIRHVDRDGLFTGRAG